MQSTYDDYTADYSSQPPNLVGCLFKTLLLMAGVVLLLAFAIGAILGPYLV